jgi:hypothetical protein
MAGSFNFETQQPTKQSIQPMSAKPDNFILSVLVSELRREVYRSMHESWSAGVHLGFSEDRIARTGECKFRIAFWTSATT